MSVDTESSSFVGRWSKRKHQSNSRSAEIATPEEAVPQTGHAFHQTADEEQSTAAIQSPDIHLTEGEDASSLNAGAASTEQHALDEVNLSEEPLLTDADMPEITSLSASSDVSMFFNKGVSEVLRRAALKHIFSLPIYNVRDGLNDYDEDYTVFEPLGDTVTCDMKFHKERKEKLAAEQAQNEEEALLREQEEALNAEQAEAEHVEAEQIEAEDGVAEEGEAEAEQQDEDQAVSNHAQLQSEPQDKVAQDNPAFEASGFVAVKEQEVQLSLEGQSAQVDSTEVQQIKNNSTSVAVDPKLKQHRSKDGSPV